MTHFGSSSSPDEPFQAASLPREEGGAACCSASHAADLALYARLDVLEAHPLLRGPLDVIEARDEMNRRLMALVDAIAYVLGEVD